MQEVYLLRESVVFIQQWAVGPSNLLYSISCSILYSILYVKKTQELVVMASVIARQLAHDTADSTSCRLLFCTYTDLGACGEIHCFFIVT